MEEIPQFFVYKENKRKRIRVLNIDGRIILQIMSLSKSYNKEVDISSVPKLFIPFFDEGCFKFMILLNDKRDSLSFSCKEENDFKDCVEHINNILQKYHKTRDSQDSVTNIIKTPSTTSERSSFSDDVHKLVQIPHRKSEEVYVKMTNQRFNPYFINKDENSEYEEVGNVIRPVKLPRKSKFYPNIAINWEYEIPEFNRDKDPLPGLCTNIKRISDVPLDEELDVNINNVLKLREEIQSPGGLLVTVSTEVLSDIEVKEKNNKIWISKVRNNHNLLRKFHVGDVICEVNKNEITKMVQYIQHCKCNNPTFRIQRLPKAKVFAMTNEVLRTSFHKRSSKNLMFVNNDQNCEKNQKNPWILTEINFTPNIDSKSLDIIAEANTPYHVVILHQNSFLKEIEFSQ